MRWTALRRVRPLLLLLLLVVQMSQLRDLAATNKKT